MIDEVEMSQLITLPTSDTDLNVASNTTTGDVDIATAQTTGALNIATFASRSGDINIDSATSTGTTFIRGIDMKISTGTMADAGTVVGDATTALGQENNPVTSGTWFQWGPVFSFNLIYTYDGKAGVTGDIIIRNMPKTAMESGAGDYEACMVVGTRSWTTISTPERMNLRIVPGTKMMEFFGETTAIAPNDVTTTGAIIMSGTYFVSD